jgi:oligosaccharide translocation protein RFT1
MRTGLYCWVISSWLELAIEPILIYIESQMIVNITVLVECISLAIHGVSCFLMLFLLEGNHLILVQSYGQLIYSLCMFGGYFSYALLFSDKTQTKSIWDSIWPKSFKISVEMIRNAQGFIFHSLGKYVTAEGERIILAVGQTAEQQGIYEFVNNLGSIVARVAFLSIEKTGFVMFTRLKSKPNTDERKSIWKMLLNVSLMISLLYISTSFNYVHFIIGLLYGSKWKSSNAPNLLAFYGIYLLLIGEKFSSFEGNSNYSLGVNGLVEALRDAIAPYQKLQKQAPYTFLFIITYFAQGYFLMYYYGAFGLIAASCLSVLQRTIFNIWFYEEDLFSIQSGLPSLDVWIVYFAICISGWVARNVFGDTWNLFAFGVLQGICYLIWIYFFQAKKVKQTLTLMKEKNK